jgi:hypothetical protein
VEPTFHPAANPDEDSDLVCGREDLLHLRDRLLERVFEVFDESSELLPTAIDAGFRMPGVRLPFEVRRDFREYAIPVTAVERLVQAPNSFPFSCDIAYSGGSRVSPSPIDLTSSDTLSLSLKR